MSQALPSDEEASHHASDLRSLLSKGEFRLTKWISTSRRVLETIPVAERAKEVKTLDLSKDDLPVERALGAKWCAETDTCGFKVDIKFKPPTRRGILSLVSSVYDPLGLAAPFVLPAKRLLQDLCRVKLDWEDPIPQKHKVRSCLVSLPFNGNCSGCGFDNNNSAVFNLLLLDLRQPSTQSIIPYTVVKTSTNIWCECSNDCLD